MQWGFYPLVFMQIKTLWMWEWNESQNGLEKVEKGRSTEEWQKYVFFFIWEMIIYMKFTFQNIIE